MKPHKNILKLYIINIVIYSCVKRGIGVFDPKRKKSRRMPRVLIGKPPLSGEESACSSFNPSKRKE